MKRLVLGLMLLMTATAASAEWAVAYRDDEIAFYFDRTTIRRNGNLVKMLNLYDNKTLDFKSTLSIRAQQEFDCKKERMRTLAQTGFSGQMAKGEVIYTNDDTKKWTTVSPGTANEKLWKIACGK